MFIHYCILFISQNILNHIIYIDIVGKIEYNLKHSNHI
jgi:hypothetical protein